jgi:beta-aspartyl-dipeptidase (metallo-type)
LPSFDDSGALTKLGVGEPASIFRELVDAVRDEGLPMDQAVRVVGANVADILKLPGKGHIVPGADADLAVLDADLRLRHVIAAGQWMMRDGELLRKGSFEA